MKISRVSTYPAHISVSTKIFAFLEDSSSPTPILQLPAEALLLLLVLVEAVGRSK